MSDRLRFRVFYKVGKDWVNVTKNVPFILDHYGRLIKHGDFPVHPIDYPERFIVEQCTGLKDKNGNLIYEGDIVRYWWNQKTNTGTIFWNNEFARFCIANNETHCPEDSNCLMFVADKKIIEIVGDIHTRSEE